MKLAGLGLPAALLGSARSSAGRTESQPSSERSGPWLEIDLGAIAWNYRQIAAAVDKRPVMAVVKANAYGLGLEATARHLEQTGAHSLAVASAASALRLRYMGIKLPILNLGPFSRAEALELVGQGVSQSVYTDDYRALAEAARKLGLTAQVHLKIDTGLGRVGVPYYSALSFIREVAATDGLKVEGIFMTFTEDPDFDREQLARFLALCADASSAGISVGLRHAASSAAILDCPEAHLDLVRPGIALYGHYPSERARAERKVDLRPALSLKAPVLYVKTLRPGDGLSYHRPFIAAEETTVATIGVGHSDGYPTAANNGGEVLIGGRRCPVLVPVTANHVIARIPAGLQVDPGDEAVLIGAQGGGEVTAEELAGCAGASVYHLLMHLSALLPREYRLSPAR